MIDVRRRILADEVVLAVFCDADHLIEEALAEKLEAFANRILIRPEPLRHRLVDDNDGRRVRLVAFGEIAPADERHAQRLEVLRRDDANLHEPTRPAIRGVLALEKDSPREAAGEKGHRVRQRRRLHACDARGALDDRALEFAAPHFGVPLRAQIEREHGQTLHVEAGTDLLCMAKAANE